MKLTAIQARVDQLLIMSDDILATAYSDGAIIAATTYVDSVLFTEWRVAGLSFLRAIFGRDHTFSTAFDDVRKSPFPNFVKKGAAILRAAKQEIDGVWLISLKGLVSAEIFSDFLEMAEHLLEQGYKDPAAVMTGSVLEEHLQQLCQNNSLPIDSIKDGKSIPKRADAMNADLTKASVYNLLSQKSVTAWLDLRNKAAHGQYSEYTDQEVKLMYQGVTDFIGRTS